MGPYDRRAERARAQQISHAFEALKRHAGYPAVHVRIYDALKKLQEQSPIALPRLTQERFAIEKGDNRSVDLSDIGDRPEDA